MTRFALIVLALVALGGCGGKAESSRTTATLPATASHPQGYYLSDWDEVTDVTGTSCFGSPVYHAQTDNVLYLCDDEGGHWSSLYGRPHVLVCIAGNPDATPPVQPTTPLGAVAPESGELFGNWDSACGTSAGLYAGALNRADAGLRDRPSSDPLVLD
jgi:hypothetical protein